MKKLFAFTLALMMVVSLYILSNAQSNTKRFNVKVNEYMIIKQYQAKSISELESIGFSKEKAIEIKNFDYEKELRQRSTLEENVLKNMGYSNEQIKVLKNFSGTEDEIMAVSSTLDLSGEINDYYYDSSSDKTWLIGYYSWEWSSTPAVMNEDAIGFGWNDDYMLWLHSSNEYKVKYKNTGTGNTYTISDQYEATGTRNAIASHEMQKNVQTKPYTYDWAYRGYGYIHLYQANKNDNATIHMKYGHATLATSVSISIPSGVGFSFDSGIETMDEKQIQDTHPRTI